jgi:predicted  nucleic acid-binding Zn-ribbon protein
MMVDGSVPELKNATDTSLKAASDTSDYIKDLDIHSATVLDMSVGFLTKNVAKGLDGVGDVLAMNPITGVLGGVCRAAGGLVEGVGTLITDPDKVWDGLKTLGGADGWKEAGEAWAGMGSAFLGGEAWKTAADAWKSGDYWKALSEGAAAVGEGGGNVLATFFTGGIAAGTRGAGLVGRIGSMTGKVGTGVMKFARVTRTTKAVLATRKFAIKSGEIGAKIGNVALAPLKYGLKPLRMFGKIGRKAEAITSRVFTPTKWAKLKPGSAAAEKAANKLLNKGAKLDGEIKALQNKIKGTKDAFERKILTKDMAYLRLKRMRLNKEINSLLGEKTIVAPKPEVVLETAAPKITLGQADANIARINRRIKAGPGPQLSPAEKAARSAALDAELKAAIAERSSLLVPGSAEAMTRVAEIDVNIARINRRIKAGPGPQLSPAEKAARSAALDAELKVAIAEKSSLFAPGSAEAMTRVAEIQTEISRINRRIAAGPGASLTPAEQAARAAALDVELNSAISEMSRLTTTPIRIPGSAEAMTRVAEIDANIARINRRIKAGPGPQLSPAEKVARSAALEAELTTAIAERSSLLVPGSAEAMTRVAEIQANIARINRRIAAGPGASLTPAEQAARAAALDAELNRSVAEMARLTTMPIPFTPISVPVATGTANGGIVSGVMAASAIPLSYNAVEIEKNKNKNIKENVPAKTEFEPTPLVDLDGSPASASGPQQTVDQLKLDFEQTNEGRFRAFFNTGVSDVDRSTIKSLVKADLASDAEITIDGVVSQNGIEDVWNLFDPNKVGAVLTKLESKKEGTKNVISKIIIDKSK